MASKLIFLNFLLFFCVADNVTAAEDIHVDLDGLGTLLGTREDFIYPYYPQRNQKVDVFRGVPYAEKPIGNLRLAKTVPKQPWSDTYNATFFRRKCWAWRNTSFEFTAQGQSEDCLYLNIWSPDVSGSNYPVMIWIHGGSFQWGAGTTKIYMGDALASYNDVVVVTINYRLNGFGFLTTADSVIPGNFALWDQSEAIRWVKTNIAKFGGDPSRITLFGQSAGGASVGYHLISPHSMSNINNGIMMSGSIGVSSSGESMRTQAFNLGRSVGCDVTYSTQLVDCLRKVPELELAYQMVQSAFGPYLDNDFFPKSPDRIYAKKEFKQSPLMIGTTKDDGSLVAMFLFVDQGFTDNPQCNRARFRRNIDRLAGGNDLVADAIEQTYIDWSQADDENANYFYDMIAMFTDSSICSQTTVANAWLNAGLPVYRYVFSYEPINTIYPETPRWKPLPPWKGVAHGDEMQFVFGSPFQFYETNGVYADHEVELSLDMMRYYTNFAKTGDPNNGGDNDDKEDDEPVWTRYELPKKIFQVQQPDMEDYPGYRSEQCALWRKLVPKLHTFSDDINSVWTDWQGDYAQWINEDMEYWKDEWSNYLDVCNSS